MTTLGSSDQQAAAITPPRVDRGWAFPGNHIRLFPGDLVKLLATGGDRHL
jgi:hypothetical protein